MRTRTGLEQGVSPIDSGSEDRDRVPGRARAARQSQWQSDNEELEAGLLLAGTSEVLELEAVRREHAHRHDLEGVDRIADPGHATRHRLAVAIGQERGDATFVHPRNGVDVE